MAALFLVEIDQDKNPEAFGPNVQLSKTKWVVLCKDMPVQTKLTLSLIKNSATEQDLELFKDTFRMLSWHAGLNDLVWK